MDYAAKYFALVSKHGVFDLHGMSRKKANVKITRSDALYDECAVKRIGMNIFEGAVPVSKYLWADHRIAWVVLNPTHDGEPLDFWWDTLSETKDEAAAWLGDTPSRKARSETLGLEVFPVVFEVID